MKTEDNREVETHSGDKPTSKDQDVCSIAKVSAVENESEMDETGFVVSDAFSLSNKVSDDVDNPHEDAIKSENEMYTVKTEDEVFTIKREDDDVSSSEVQLDLNVENDKRKTKYHPCEFPGCTKSFSRPDRLRKHAHVHTNVREFICSIISCNKSYTTAQHLRRHYTAVHLSDPRTPPPVPCDDEQCDKVFQHKDSMKKHYQKHHINVRPRHACDKCSASFYYRGEYYKHRYEIHGIEMFKCDRCNIVFTRQTDMTRHMRGHRTYTCEEPECNGMTFERFNDKRKHDSIVHPILYTCHHCDFKAQRKFFLEEHMYSKHLPRWERPLLLCSFENCQRTFHHTRNYVLHFKKKHLNESTRFICPLGCPQTFATKQSCQRHVKVMHMDKGGAPQEELPFSCEYCYKKFGRQYNVRRHYLRMHADLIAQANSCETTITEDIQNSFTMDETNESAQTYN
uniref:Transcription factor IIIA n=1 Tax=Cacopsylla melanoneura TaxID=428564 RepID=A0A8D8YA01_9HEMI